MFDPKLPIAGLTPASYNPRKIDPETADALAASIRDLGVIRPIIATTSGTLVAGHQRTNAMRRLGITHAPGYVLPPIGPADEVRFNQLHNASDVELADFRVRISPGPDGGWYSETSKGIAIEGTPRHAAKRDQMLMLLTKYGEWSSVVASETGEVLVGQLYANACKILRRPLRVRYVPEASRDAVLAAFGRQYGEFSYAHLPRTTWVQTLAQMHRLRGQEVGGKSRTYETQVIPRLRPGMRVLDFGCGQGDYVAALASKGVDIIGVEFYRRVKGALAIDVPAVRGMVDAMCRALRERGLFDMVVCDSVLNSVDTPQAERDVLATVSSLCRPGGQVVISGRRRDHLDGLENNTSKKSDPDRLGLVFPDRDGFSAMYRQEGWLYQRFHWDAEVREIARRYVGPDAVVKTLDDSWFIAGPRTVEPADVVVEAALAREFDLPLPDGTTYGLSEAAVSAWRAALRLP